MTQTESNLKSSGASLSFTERMAGQWLKFKTSKSLRLPILTEDYIRAENDGSREDLEFTLTIKVNDMNRFVNDPELLAEAVGTVSSTSFGTINVEKGIFNLFVRAEASKGLNTAKEMHYCLYFYDIEKKPMTLFGFKEVEKEDGIEAWKETTTLYTAIWEGHSDFKPNEEKKVIGLGVLHISVGDFIKQLGTFESNGKTLADKTEALTDFMKVFAGNLWQAYAPSIFDTATSRWNEHIYPLQTTAGVIEKNKEQFTFNTADGIALTLARFTAKPSKKIVLLLHGLSNSTDMFIMPEHVNIVNYLHSHGLTDIWSLDWRGSGRFTYNLIPSRYTLDDVIRYDMPAAVSEIRKRVGEDAEIHVVAHCVGSITFMCSLAAGHIEGIKSIVSNSVSLTPKVSWPAFIKVLVGSFVFENIFRYPYISPMMPYSPAFGFGKWIYYMERLFRRECKEPACHMISFMWGWGYPAAYEHKNIHEVTHRRLKDLFGGVGFHYYRHIRKMLFKKEAVPYDHKMQNQDLPESYLQNMKNIKVPPTLFISGSENRIFPGSNKETYERLKQMNSSWPIQFREIMGYGHQDTFIGKNAHLDVYPHIVDFIKQHSS